MMTYNSSQQPSSVGTIINLIIIKYPAMLSIVLLGLGLYLGLGTVSGYSVVIPNILQRF